MTKRNPATSNMWMYNSKGDKFCTYKYKRKINGQISALALQGQ